jgi:hypothetical protein
MFELGSIAGYCDNTIPKGDSNIGGIAGSCQTKWQVSANSTTWSNVTTGTGVKTNTYTTPVTTTAMNGYKYR